VSETGLISILVIAFGLSADCFAVAFGSSVSRKNYPIRQFLRLAISFGLFQAFMTFLGWLAGNTIIKYISTYDHWVAFGLLAFVGGRMVWESVHDDETHEKTNDFTRWWLLLTLSIATSLDALAVGLSFAFLNVNIAAASLTIGLVAFAITILGAFLGKRLGAVVGKRAELAGGIILIIIGIRILLEHLL
jgi:manganese efflux pump family protein